MLQDGQADSVWGLPSTDFPAVQKLQSQGLVDIYNFPTFTVNFYEFNIEIDKDLEATQFGTGFNEPSNYFADLPTRLAWINAFDYAGYINNILGNAKYGADFGTSYQGIIPAGMIYSPPAGDLGGLPAMNLDAARGNYSISAWANQKITVPIVVWIGDPVDLAGAEEWASILGQISNGNINAKVVQITYTQLLALLAQGSNPMGVSLMNWLADYADPSDYVDGMYVQGGAYSAGDNLFVNNFGALPPSNPNGMVHLNGSTYSQQQVYGWLNGNITLGNSALDPVVRQRAYLITEKLAIAMGLYVYVYQAEGFWIWRTWLKGYAMQENTMIAENGALLFYWLIKE
jgi:hypothetical protein